MHVPQPYPDQIQKYHVLFTMNVNQTTLQCGSPPTFIGKTEMERTLIPGTGFTKQVKSKSVRKNLSAKT